MKVWECTPKSAEWADYIRISTQFRIGVEYEVESVKQWDEAVLTDRGIRWVKDGSLRNNGLEFITQPETKVVSLLTFKRLFENVRLGAEPFSPRTSIHIHMNVAAMEESNFLSMLYTYAALEPVFFKYVGPVRLHNIHCVPLRDTYLSKYYKHHQAAFLAQKWHKYTALNIRPLMEQGSIEFRHMYGTKDPQSFMDWVDMIESLYNWGLKTDLPALKKFWIDGGSGKQLEQAVFNKQTSLTESDFRTSVMESKSAFI
jgi:hypothetical protein